MVVVECTSVDIHVYIYVFWSCRISIIDSRACYGPFRVHSIPQLLLKGPQVPSNGDLKSSNRGACDYADPCSTNLAAWALYWQTSIQWWNYQSRSYFSALRPAFLACEYLRSSVRFQCTQVIICRAFRLAIVVVTFAAYREPAISFLRHGGIMTNLIGKPDLSENVLASLGACLAHSLFQSALDIG